MITHFDRVLSYRRKDQWTESQRSKHRTKQRSARLGLALPLGREDGLIVALEVTAAVLQRVALLAQARAGVEEEQPLEGAPSLRRLHRPPCILGRFFSKPLVQLATLSSTP